MLVSAGSRHPDSGIGSSDSESESESEAGSEADYGDAPFDERAQRDLASRQFTSGLSILDFAGELTR